MAKELQFKLVLNADVRQFITNTNQSKETVKAMFDEIKKQSAASATATKTATDGIDKIGDQAQQSAVQMTQLDNAMGKTNAEMNKAHLASDNLNKGITGLRGGYSLLTTALAAVGVGLGVGEIIKAADSYTLLSTRIKVTTKDGGDFQGAMEGVQRVALQTNASLEATGSLFVRLNTVGKDLGITQERVLGLTKTVQQAIQIGGGSAAASEAAVQQFIQAMQGGVLRGEEFNSIMENGFGLAEALAKGLGVTTGELRKMAEAGELSAERVIKAIQSQSDEVQKTYSQFPQTIGQALQKISTSWQILIGEMNSANATSSVVAGALSSIADNLGILKTFFDDAGQGIAFFRDRLSEIEPSTIEAIKSALSQAYDAVKSLLGSLADLATTGISAFNSILDAIAPVFNTILGGQEDVSGLATAFNVLNVALGLVADGATGINIALKLALSAIQFLGGGILALQSNILSMIPSMGELADEAQKSSDRMFAAAQKNATDANKLALESKSLTIQALDEIQKTQVQKNAESLANTKAKLDAVLAMNVQEVAASKATENDKTNAVKAYVQAAITANKGVLDGVIQADLLTKGYIVTVDNLGKASVEAWKKAETGANNVAVSADNARKAADALGLDLDVSLNRVSEKFTETSKSVVAFVAGLDKLGITGENAGKVTLEAWQKWLDTARSQVEVDIAKAKLVEFGKQGKLSTSQVKQGMIAVKNQAAEVAASIDPVTAAFERLGIKTKEALKSAAKSALADFNTIRASGKATSEDLQQAYERTIQAAIASGDEVTISLAKAQAGTAGLAVEVDEAGKATVLSFEQMNDAAVSHASTVSNTVTSAYRQMGDVAREEARSSIDAWNDAVTAQASADRAKDTQRTAGMGGTFDAFTQSKVFDRIKSLGFDDAQAKKFAESIMIKAFAEDRRIIERNRANPTATTDITNKLFEDLRDRGMTSAFGNQVVEESLANLARGAGSGGISSPSKTVKYELTANGQTAIVEGDDKFGDTMSNLLKQIGADARVV